VGLCDKNHDVSNGPIANPKNAMKIQKICQQQNNEPTRESSINFKPLALATQVHQHLLERIVLIS